MKVEGIRIAIDRGGTFTDVLAMIPGSEDYVFKLLSVDPNNYKDSITEAIRRVLSYTQSRDIPRTELLDTSSIASIRMGTTIATNALLERKGSRTAFLVTKGFKDLLHIGDQSRPDLFALNIVKPKPLYEQCVEVDERVTLPAYDEDPSGYSHRDKLNGVEFVTGATNEVVQVLKTVDVEQVRTDLLQLKESGIESVGVCLLHGYNYQEHEKIVGAVAKEVGFKYVTMSHELLPMIKMVSRGHSVCVDSYLTPIVKEYIENFLSGFLPNFDKTTRVELMQSDGGLCSYEKFNGLGALLSGPAGGVVGQAETCYDTNNKIPVVGFDMGGTSTDVSRYSGHYEHVFETKTAGIQIAAPQLDINTVAAGGGSILFYKNGVFSVGPESASAHPGPACYRKGGPLTITDANLFTGRILPEYFPKIFGPTEDQPLDKEIVQTKFEELARIVNADNPEYPKTAREIALGFLEVANVSMAKPIRALTESKGYDVTKHVLASFGGAGGQHATSIAKVLKINRVIIHKYSSILSAYGIALADIVEEVQEPCFETYSESSRESLLTRCRNLCEKVKKELLAQNIEENSIQYEIYFNMGYQGSDTRLMILKPVDDDFAGEFVKNHEREFSFKDDSRDILVNDIRVRATGNVGKLKEPSAYDELSKIERVAADSTLEETTRMMHFDQGELESKIYFLKNLKAGTIVQGPALILDATQTILVTPDSVATILPRHVIIDVKTDDESNKKITTNYIDPIQVAIFSNRFMAIAEDMGRTLQKISISANIKERLDFSCALFDNEGSLTANAPHVPVHLGSMSFAVRFAIDYWGDDIKPGDVLASNHPIAGGTHLPDITLISPVFIDGKITFFTAARAHHSDIGGTVPGSCDARAIDLAQEGAQFVAWKVVKEGKFDYEGVEKFFVEEPAKLPGSSGSRNINNNLSDLKAQIASNQRGIVLLKELFAEHGSETVLFYMKAVRKTAETAVRDYLSRFYYANKDRLPLRATEYLDDGSNLSVCIDIKEDGSAIFNWDGTSEEAFNCSNCPRAVTNASVIYSLRCLIDADVPLNDGCLDPIKIVIPEGSILNPSPYAAVNAGNGNISQRITDTILKAFEVVGCFNGSMNGVTFGQGGIDEHGNMKKGFGFCETVGGGSGAGEGFDGFSGTQCHMTNTKITDPEILEKRYPCILKQYCIRIGSGGEGKWKGGDGLIREIEFTTDCHGSISSQCRVVAPYGIRGGEPALRGQNLLGRRRDNGSIQWIRVSYGAEIELKKGDIIMIKSPGGGGYGVKNEQGKTTKKSVSPGFVPLAGGSFSILQEASNTSQ